MSLCRGLVNLETLVPDLGEDQMIYHTELRGRWIRSACALRSAAGTVVHIQLINVGESEECSKL